MTFSDLYCPIDASLIEQVKHIKLIAFDVDGIFSDGRITLGNQGEELKDFNTLDGYGVKAIIKLGIEVVIITGKQSKIVENRMSNLGVEHVIQNCENKYQALKQFAEKHNYNPQDIASMGDDMADLGMFRQSSLKFSVPNGHPYLQKQANYVTSRLGGHGAVREVCDLILDCHGSLINEHEKSE